MDSYKWPKVGLLLICMVWLLAAAPPITDEEIYFIEKQVNSPGLDSPGSIAISPDDAYVYVTGGADDSLSLFSRNSTTGKLTYVEAYKDGLNGIDGLDGAFQVIVSPDGLHVYVTGSNDNAMTAFSRNAADGKLTLIAVYKDGENGIDGMATPLFMAMSADGKHFYISTGTDSLVVFSRNSVNGQLTFVEVLKDDSLGGTVVDLDNPQLPAVSPDGKHVYVPVYFDDALNVFSRNAATGQLTFVEVHKDGQNGVDGLNAATSALVSPDDNHVYVTGQADDSVALFNRDTVNGTLTYVEHQQQGANGVDGLADVDRTTLSADGKHLYTASRVSDAVAVFSRNAADGKLTFVEVQKDGINGADGLDGAFSVVVSFDGKHVYAAAAFENALAVFSRNFISGSLSFVEVIKQGDFGTVGLQLAVSIALSPDGKHLYTLGQLDSAVALFNRDTVNGNLTYVEAYIDGRNGIDGLIFPQMVTVSPDGKHVYVANGVFEDTVVIFSRNSSTGKLGYIGFIEDDQGGVDGLDGATSIIVSPDNKHVYVTGRDEHKVAVFSRNDVTGQLTFVEIEEDGINGVDGLHWVRSVTISPDGKHVYVASEGNDDAVVVFSRNDTTGELTFVEVYKDDQNSINGLDGVRWVAISPDGNHVYAAGTGEHSVVVFSRNTADGKLTFVELYQNGLNGVDGLDNVNSLMVSPNGQYLYTTSPFDNTVSIFERNANDGTLTYLESQKDNQNGFDGLAGPQQLAVSADVFHHIYVASISDNAVAVLGKSPKFALIPYVIKN